MRLRFFFLVVAFIIMTGTACMPASNTVFSDNFDGKVLKPGASIKAKPLEWNLVAPNIGGDVGDVSLGSGEHGWTGNYIQGNTATSTTTENIFMKYIPSLSGGVVNLSFKAFAAGSMSDDSTVGLCAYAVDAYRVMWVSTADGWQLLIGKDGPDGTPTFINEAFKGGHDVTVQFNLYVDTAKLKVWGKAVWVGGDGKQVVYETKKYDCDRRMATVSGVVISIDRRSGRTGMDIDDIKVQKDGTTLSKAIVNQRGWRKHVVRQRAGVGKEINLSAKMEMVSEDLNRFMAVPYIAYMPEKNRLLLLEGNDYPHRAETLYSDDLGLTWSEPKLVSSEAGGLAIGLTNLGGGNLMLNMGKHYFSSDFGETWGNTIDVPPASNGRGWYEWDPVLVDKDKPGKVTRLMSYCSDNMQPDGHFQGYIRFSDDVGKTWRDEVKIPEMYAVNEVAFVRAKNGDIVAACRTDNPDRFKDEIDHYGGLAVSISKDNGLTWSKLNWLYEWGRHHACMVLMPNGDIVMTYVVRKGYIDTADGYPQFGIEAVVSRDNGKTWDLDHKYILHSWKGNRKEAEGWWASSQATSTVRLPDGSLITAYGTGYRSQPTPKGAAPRDVGLIRWKLNNKPVATDRTISDSPYNSDTRNVYDPTVPGKKATKLKDPRAGNIAVAKRGAVVTASECDKKPDCILRSPDNRYRPLTLTTTPAWIEISWPKDQKIKKIDIYPGESTMADMPSTECVPLDYSIQYDKNEWVDLVPSVFNAQRYKDYAAESGGASSEFKYSHQFAPITVKRIRLNITRSSDPGTRISSPTTPVVAVEKRETVIRAIEVY